jgi:hypothetical protein
MSPIPAESSETFGLPTPTETRPRLPLCGAGAPEPLTIDPADFLYVGATGISAFSVNVTTGTLSPVSGTPFSMTTSFTGGLAIAK